MIPQMTFTISLLTLPEDRIQDSPSGLISSIRAYLESLGIESQYTAPVISAVDDCDNDLTEVMRGCRKIMLSMKADNDYMYIKLVLRVNRDIAGIVEV